MRVMSKKSNSLYSKSTKQIQNIQDVHLLPIKITKCCNYLFIYQKELLRVKIFTMTLTMREGVTTDMKC